jgi:predicted PurR-regulated permease PerM
LPFSDPEVSTVAAPSSQQPRWLRSYLLTFLVLAVLALLYFARPVVVPVALAVMLAFVLSPLVTRVQRWGLGRIPAVMLVVVLALALVGGLGYVLSRQLAGLADQLPRYRTQIAHKIEGLRGAGEGGVIGRVRQALHDISDEVLGQERSEEQPFPEKGPGSSPENPLYVSTAPSPLFRLVQIIGPAGEGLVQTALVVVLVVFILINRENLRNRLVRLAGPGRLVVTTRVFDEGAHRISRYLSALLCINATFGLCIALGVAVTGLLAGQPALYQYAVLWGLVCGSLRFIPYLGTWAGAALLVAYSVAVVPGWGPPVGLFVYFCVVELIAANVAEPVLFGHSTGSSPIALLLATAFWAWLWGPVGLVLATPLTVSLVVLGKYIPDLHFFAVLLGDQEPLRPPAVYYQRLLARDQDEASDLAEEQAESNGTGATFEEVLVPALIMARRDREHGDLEDDQFQFVLDATREVLEELPEPAANGEQEHAPPVRVLGCPARDEADELSLRMLDRALSAVGHGVEVLSSKMLTAEVLAALDESCPPVVCIGSLGPGGLAQVRYLCKRLRAQCPGMKIVVARWGDVEGPEKEEKRLLAAGADHVVRSFKQARGRIVPLLQVAAACEHEELAKR